MNTDNTDTIIEFVNRLLNNVDQAGFNLLYSTISSISESKRDGKSKVSGIAATYESVIRSDGFGQAVNEALDNVDDEGAERLLAKIVSIRQNGENADSVVSAILQELARIIDIEGWLTEDEEPSPETANDDQPPPPETKPEDLPPIVRDELDRQKKEQASKQAQDKG